MRVLLGVGVVVLAISLAGCVGGGDPAAQQSPTASSTPPSSGRSPTPTPPVSSPTPTPTLDVPDGALPRLDALVLATGGFDQLPLSSDPALSSLVKFELLECGFDEPVEAWNSAYPRQDELGGYLRSFYVAIARDGLLSAIQVLSSDVTTPEGVGPGSTRDEVLAAYPGIVVAGSSDRHDVYTIDGPDGRLTIAVGHNRTYEAWEPDDVETVTEMVAARLEYSVYYPSFHPIGATCL